VDSPFSLRTFFSHQTYQLFEVDLVLILGHCLAFSIIFALRPFTWFDRLITTSNTTAGGLFSAIADSTEPASTRIAHIHLSPNTTTA
jgi:hypothetical protein